jgi:pimeloyl-ACP methyl ester carboxylesterase
MKASHIHEELAKCGSFARINGINSHVWEMGSGIPLVFIHGFMGGAYDWRFNVPELSKHFAVKAFDLPGFGYSEKPLDFPYTSEGYADFVKAYLDVCDIGKAVLVGNSMGGQIALETYLKYSDRVSSLILIDSGGYPGSVRLLLFRLLKIQIVGTMMMSLITPLAVRYVLKNDILCDDSSVTDEAVNYYYNVYKTTNARKIPPVVVKNMIRDERYICSKWNEIKCPTLVIWGAQDKVIPRSYAEFFKEALPTAKLMIVEGAGHMPHIDKAKVVNDAVVDFVNKAVLDE